MPISAEQWRISVGLANASRHPRPCVCNQTKLKWKWTLWDLLFLLMTALLEDILLTGGSRKQKAKKVHSRGKSNGGTDVELTFSLPTTHQKTLLLLLAGDVETNPGPILYDRLYVSDLARLVKETIAAKEKWDKIGQELRVSEQYLAFIRTRYSTSHDRLVEMLRKRLKQSVITTWKDIVAALISDHVGELQLADQIKANLIGRIFEADLDVLLEAVGVASGKWYQLGQTLGIPDEYLTDVHTSCGTSLHCLREVLRKWLQKSFPIANWKNIIAALRSSLVGESNLACHLKEKHIPDLLEYSHLDLLVQELSKVKCKWQDIAQKLGFSTAFCVSTCSIYSDDNNCLKEVLRQRLQWGTLTTWRDIVAVLRTDVEEYQLANQLETKYCPVLQVQLEKALKKGYIITDLTTCIATGAPGCGKTHLHYLLYGLIPPDIRISTACIEEAQRAVIGSIDCEYSHWKPVRSSELKKIVAEGDFTCLKGIEDQIPTSAPNQSDIAKVAQDNTSLVHDPVNQSSKTCPSTYVAQEKVETEHSCIQDVKLLETADILKLMKTSSTFKKPLQVHWMHFIDSGGQPQFLEILPAFVRNVSLLMLLVKLSEELSDNPVVEYFSPDGSSYQLGVFPLSNTHLLLQTAQLSLFHHSQISLPHIQKGLLQPNMVIIGTFADQESKCKETRSEKNTQLKKLFKPFQKQLIPRSEYEILFPVNTKSAGKGKSEDPVAAELRQVIQKLAPRLTIRFPLQWYFLEMELRRLGLKVVAKSKCWAIAKKLGFESKEALEAALLYLHEANLFLYYPEVLSNTIFVDPQAVLNIITQLYEHHIKLENATESDVKDEEELRYRDQALFTASDIASLKSNYNKDVFPDEDLILLLQHRLIISALSFFIKGEASYMMPSLLPTFEEVDTIRPNITSASPLLIAFQEGWAPTGLFCALLVTLLSCKSQFQWKVTTLVSGNMSKLYKNHFQFSIGDMSGSVTLVNTMKQFELHPSSNLPSFLLPWILEIINKCLNEACSKYSYRISHRFAFKCNCEVSSSHTALISPDKSCVQCTQDIDKIKPLSSMQKLWVQSDYAGLDKVEVQTQTITVETVEQYVQTMEQHVQPRSSAQQQGPTSSDTLPEQSMKVELEAKDKELTGQLDQTKPKSNYNSFDGVELVGQVELVITKEAKHFHWKNHGFKLHIPENALPEGSAEHLVNIKASLAGKFKLNEGYELVSALYWVATSGKFTKPVRIEVQHCANFSNPDQLRFVSTSRADKSLPLTFKVIDGGSFILGNKYGTLCTTHFCGVSIVKKVIPEEHSCQYCAQVYFTVKNSKDHLYYCHFVITKDLDIYRTVVKRKYQQEYDIAVPITFGSDQVALDIPDDGMVTENGWKVRPLYRAYIRKEQVDNYLPETTMVPECVLLLKWLQKDKTPDPLEYKVNLLGTGNKDDFICIIYQPESQNSRSASKLDLSIPTAQEVEHQIAAEESSIEEPRVELTIADLCDVTNYLLELGQTCIYSLGLILGLDYRRLKTMGGSETFRDDVIAAWLQREDNVIGKGLPTWSALVKALRHPRLNKTGLADKIATEKKVQ